jgi:hypothetical protein
MKPPNKESSGTRSIQPPLNRPAGHALFKPVVAQTKTPMSAPSVSRPVASRPQAVPKATQLKVARIVPPVYHPHSVPRVLQTKSSCAQSQPAAPVTRPPVAAPIYRPEVKKILQPKTTSQHQKSHATPISQVLSGVGSRRLPNSSRASELRTPIKAVSHLPRSRPTGAGFQRAADSKWRASGKRVGSTVVIQRSEQRSFDDLFVKEKDEAKSHYKNRSALLVTLKDENAEQQKRLREVKTFYSDLKFSIKGAAVWDASRSQMGQLESKEKTENYSLVVIAGHGNLQWLLGRRPGSENQAMGEFVKWLHQLEADEGYKVKTIVLDSCWSAAELMDAPVNCDSSARILSRLLGGEYRVIGFNGKACTPQVRYKIDGRDAHSDYPGNAVVFNDGGVIKGSIHKEQGKGIQHSSEHINDGRRFYKKLFPKGAPKLYRSKSFSEASEKKPL